MKKIIVFAFFAMPMYASGATTFVYDTFTGANGSTMTATGHAGETGASWVAHSSFTNTYSIQTNRAATSNAVSTAMSYASGTPSSADYDVDATFKVVSANYEAFGQGIAMRVSNTPVNTMIFGRYVVTSGWQAYQTVNGTSLQIGISSAATLTSGNSYAVKLSAVGTAVTLSVGGVTVVSGTTTITSAGKVGIRGVSATSNTGIHIDDITASETVSGGVVATSDGGESVSNQGITAWDKR